MDKIKHKNHHKNNFEYVSGADYDTEQGWHELYRLIEQQVNKTYPNQYDAKWLTWMTRLDQQPNGFSTGIRAEGILQCLLVAEWQYNMWINQRDCVIVGLLKKPKCDPHYVDLLLARCEHWALTQDCNSINIFTWDARKAYQRWCTSKGFRLHQYCYTKEMK
jgi:hypothetical protein